MKRTLHEHGLFRKIMKLSLTQFFLAVLCVGISYASDTHAQELLEKRISLWVQDQSVKAILSKIETEASVKFIYSPKAIQAQRRTSLQAMNQSLEEVLSLLLKPLDIKYRVVGNRIVLSQQAVASEEENPNPNDEHLADITITGTVTDENGAGLPGVSILVKGTQKGTTTDPNGKYKIDVPNGDAILVFSFVGYLPQEVTVGNSIQLNIALKVDNKALEEVIPYE